MATGRWAVEADRATKVALARWQVIAAAADEGLSPSERGRTVSEIARAVHVGADGRRLRVTRRTIYRWLARWREGGFEGLKPRRRKDAGIPRTDPEILTLAAALRREAPARSAAHIVDVLARTRGWEVSERTLQRFFARQGLTRTKLEGRTRAFGRFEAAACGDLWTADGWDGPAVAELAGRHAQLFSILDDHSRFLPHGRFFPDVSEWSFQRCLKTAVARRGIPRRLYVDRGSAFVSGQLKLICGRLGIQITHSAPYRPQGRGKKERLFRTVAEQFAVEVELTDIETLAELNGFFAAWVEQVYHRRIHGGTGQTPLERWEAGPTSLRPAPDPEQLRATFLWEATRVVARTRTVSLHGNRYEVDPALVGAKVTLTFDPTDLSRIDVHHNGEPAGTAEPFEIGVHVDPKLADLDPTGPGQPTGIAYLEAVAADHAELLRGQLTYRDPDSDPDPDPDDLDLDPDPDDRKEHT